MSFKNFVRKLLGKIAVLNCNKNHDTILPCHGNFGPPKLWSGGPNLQENWSAGPLFSENFGPHVELWSEQKMCVNATRVAMA